MLNHFIVMVIFSFVHILPISFPFCCVAEGLRYLREQKVVHRDIKPGNIMKLVTAEGRWVNNVNIVIKSTMLIIIIQKCI